MAEKTKAEREREVEEKERSRICTAYRLCFSTGHGRTVLEDLTNGYLLSPGVNPDKRDTILTILHLAFSRPEDSMRYLLKLEEDRNKHG